MSHLGIYTFGFFYKIVLSLIHKTKAMKLTQYEEQFLEMMRKDYRATGLNSYLTRELMTSDERRAANKLSKLGLIVKGRTHQGKIMFYVD